MHESEDEFDNALRRPRRKRGPYKTYLESGQPYVVPRTTEISRQHSAARRQQQADEGQNDSVVGEDHLAQTVERTAGVSFEDADRSRARQPADVQCTHGHAETMQMELEAETYYGGSHEMETEQVSAQQSEDVLCAGACTCGKCVLMNHHHPDHVSQDEPNLQQKPSAQKKCIDKYGLNEFLLPTLPTTKYEAMLMILHLGIRHGITSSFVEDMLKFVNAIVDANVLPTSSHIFNKVFQPTCEMKCHYFCTGCEHYLGEKNDFQENSVICGNCEENCSVNGWLGDNYFISLSVKQQIEMLLSRKDITIMPRQNQADGNVINDIVDSRLYRSMCRPGEVMSNENSISVCFNTDGAAVYSSSRGSLWPIQLYVNEVPPESRFKCENVIVAGLWFGKSAPNMSCFFQPFVNEFQDLKDNGVKCINPDGSTFFRPVFAIVCSVDSVAKPKVQNVKQFNGTYGCGYCLHPNPAVPEDGNRHRYVPDRSYPFRTHEGMIDDMVKADELDRKGLLKKSKQTDDSVHGVKGLSPLAVLPGFNLVFGFGIDYMHAVLEGVIDKYTDILCNSENHGKDYYLGREKQLLIDSRLQVITPPQVMTRYPRAITERSQWKAREWRSFFLYFALPCMVDILPDPYFKNLQLLVSGISVLLKESILNDELSVAQEDLEKCVKDFCVLYGIHNFTYNFNLVTHLLEVVSQLGPLWAYSTFPFESGNGHMLKLIKGTRGIIHQIGRKYLTVQCVSKHVENNPVSQAALNFCANVISYEYVKKSEQFGNVTVLGKEAIGVMSEEEQLALSCYFGFTGNKIPYFNRVIRGGIVYYSRAYSKPTVFDDTCVILTNNSYAIIEKIIKSPNQNILYALVHPVRLSERSDHLAPHIKTCAYNFLAPVQVVEFCAVKEMCVKVSFEDKTFICDVPNRYERD